MPHRDSDQLLAGPYLAGVSLYHNDRRHLLVMKGRIIPLTKTEYLLTMCLLRNVEQIQRLQKPHASSAGRMNFFVSIDQLLQATPGSQETMRQHIRNASSKLAPYGISLAAVGSYGYTAVFLWESEPVPENHMALVLS